MSDFVDALSSYRQSLSEYLRDKYDGLSTWLGFKKNRLSRKCKAKFDYVKNNTLVQGKEYLKYFLYEFAPYVVAYGVMLNFPASVLFGWALTAETVVSWGLVFYFVSEEFPSIANELKPYVKINAKVDN